MDAVTPLRLLRAACRLWLPAALLLLLPATAASGQATPQLFEELRRADMKLAAIGWRLARANAALCDRLEAGTGLQLHTLDQFEGEARDAARGHFGFATPVAIEGIVPGSPAAGTELRPDDSLVRIGSVEVGATGGKPGTTGRLVATQLAIAALPRGAPIRIEALRGGTHIEATIMPVAVCKSRFELEISDAYDARADGSMVQVSSRILEEYPEEQFAALVAHEFAHNILRHRERLEARGVDFGLLAGFGGNVKYFRQTEVQADLLGLYLLANAGYDPRAAARFWRRFGPEAAGGIFRSRTHPKWQDRLATIEAEIAKMETISVRPIVPAILAERDRPLDGDWQAILVRRR